MTPPPDPPTTDPGLARERTELAWYRTGIAFAVLGGMVLKLDPVVGALILALSLPIFVIGRSTRSAVRGERTVDAAARRRSLLLITIAVTIVSLAALAMAFLSKRHPMPPF